MRARIWFPLLTLIVYSTSLFSQQSEPKPPPQGARRDPGLFRGEKPKKGEEENTRDLGGIVRNAQEEPIEGAVVQLKDTKTLRVRSFITKSDGKYNFYGLMANVDYEIRADYRDTQSEKKTLSVFDSRKLATINLTLQSKKKDKENTQ